MSHDIVAEYNRELARHPPRQAPPCSLLPRKRALTPPPSGDLCSESQSTYSRPHSHRRYGASKFRSFKLPFRTSLQTQSPTSNPNPAQITCNPQNNSPLFTLLSRELRDMIYTELLAPRQTPLHIILDRQGSRSRSRPRVVTVPCYERRSDIPTWDHRCWVSRREAEGKHEIPRGNGVVELGRHRGRGRVRFHLGVLRVCRRVYAEALPILYEKNTFALRSSETISLLPKHILPARLHSIRAIHFTTRAIFTAFSNSVFACPVPEWAFNTPASWIRAWNLLESMKGLRELVVTLDAQWGYDLERTIPWLLEPMRNVSVEEFRVVVVCEEDLEDVVAGLGDVPFRFEVVRPVKQI